MTKFYTTVLCAIACFCGALSSYAQDDLKVIVDMDFSKYYDGSRVAVGTDLVAGSSKYSYKLYTDTKWTGSKITAGDGCILVADGGYLESYYLEQSIPANTPIRVTAVIKAADNMGAAQMFLNYSINSNAVGTAYLYDDEWTEVSFINAYASTLGSTAIFKLEPYLAASGIYVKSVKIETSSTFVTPPSTLYFPTDADGTQFTARWAAVTDATGYEIDVYSYSDNGEKVYVVEKEKVTTTSYKVTGLNPSVTYYYVVRTIKGDNISGNSAEIEVVKVLSSIDTPENPVVTAVTDNGFTVSWDAVDEATHYVVAVHEHETLEDDQEAVVFGEDFEGINVGSFSVPTYTGYINDFTKESGWLEQISAKAFAPGMYVLSPYSSAGYLATPAIDLSANNGSVTVVINAAEINYGSYKSGTTFTVDAIDGKETVDTKNVLSTQEVVTDATDFKDYKVELTGCTANTRIRIGYPSGAFKFYIDNLDIMQVVPAGTTIIKQTANVETPETTHTFEYALPADKKVSFTVQSVGRTVSGNSVVPITSKATDHVFVDSESGVESVVTDNGTVNAWKAGSGLIAVNGSSVKVFNTAGSLIYAAEGLTDTNYITLGVKGIVIVVVDGKAVKIAL